MLPYLKQQVNTTNSYKIKKLKEGEKISIVSDSMFHAMLNNTARKKFTAYLLSIILEVSFDEIYDTLEYIKNKLDKDKSIEKNRTVDFLCKVNGEYIGVEMNNNYSPTRLERNISYAGDIYKMNMKTGVPYEYNTILQINLNNFSFSDEDKILDEFEFRNNKGEALTDKIRFIYIYLPNIRKKLYNKDNLSELEKFILVMCEENINLSKDLGRGNKIMEDYIDDAVYASDEEILDIYDGEVVRQMEMQDMKKQGIELGIETGRKERQLEIARNLLVNNVSIDIIANSTGLSIEEIQNL